MKKKNFNLFYFIEEQYKISFKYILESKNFIYSVIGLFLLFSLIGFFIPLPDSLSLQILNYFKELVEKTKDFGLVEMILFLFNNNSLSSLVGIFSGPIFGILPFFNTIMNGFVLGFAAQISVTQNGISSLWRLFPHGIFELPALFISLGLGLKFSTFIFKKKKLETFGIFFLNSLSAYFFVVLPLLVIAAIIEGILIFLIS